MNIFATCLIATSLGVAAVDTEGRRGSTGFGAAPPSAFSSECVLAWRTSACCEALVVRMSASLCCVAGERPP